jgi:sugar/nucleoside kinase (ribokinase family)
MPQIFVIGAASLDVLHSGARTVQTVGGAGLYTALAAQRAGASPLPLHMP